MRQEADAEALGEAGSERLVPVMLDVTDPGQIAAAAEQIAATLDGSGLDGLVNNAGAMIPSPLETLPIEDFRRQIEINLTGQVAVTQALLPQIRMARGRIVFISSIGGRIAFPLTGAYHAAKFGVEAVGDVFRQELRSWGISVSLVEPGSIDTPIWVRGEREVDAVGERAPPSRGPLRRGDGELSQGRRKAGRAGDPARSKVAEVIEHALSASRPRTRYLVGLDAKIQARLKIVVPARLFDRAVARAMNLGGPLTPSRPLILSTSTDWSARRRSPEHREEIVARSGSTAQLDEREGPEPRGGRAAGARRRRRRRRSGGAAGEVEPAGRGRGAAGRGRAARRPQPDRRPRLGADELGIHLLAGSICERGAEKASNTSVLIGPDGEDLAVYRKIHMFDVDAGGVSYRESEHEQPGSEIVTAPLGELIAGLTVCYDLRFPELYRILALRCARTVGALGLHRRHRPRPLGGAAAGAGDREPGLRPRPNQVGRACPALRLSASRTSIVDPWGVVLATAPGECFVAADLDFEATGSASRCPRWPTASPPPMSGRS